MKRKLIGSLVLVIMLMVLTTTVFAAQPIRVFVDNTQVPFDVQPAMINGRTMVPLGSVLNTLGLRYQWYEKGQNIYILGQNSMCYELTLNNTEVEMYEVVDNGSSNMRGMRELLGPHNYQTLDTAPIAINGRTMVPIRFLSEVAGYDITWDNDNSIAVIHTDPNYYSSLAEAPISDPANAGNVAVDKENMQLMVNDIVYDFAELNGKNYIIYAKIVSIGTNNDIQLQWFDVAEFRWMDKEIPLLDYFRSNLSEFSLLQRSSGITFDTLQWYQAKSVYLNY